MRLQYPSRWRWAFGHARAVEAGDIRRLAAEALRAGPFERIEAGRWQARDRGADLGLGPRPGPVLVSMVGHGRAYAATLSVGLPVRRAFIMARVWRARRCAVLRMGRRA